MQCACISYAKGTIDTVSLKMISGSV